MLVKHLNVIVVAGLLLITGCQSWRANHAASANTVTARRSPEDVKFETTNDPPIKARTHFAAGQVAEGRQDFNRAIEQYWAAVKIEPKYKDALFRLGVVYSQLKLYPDAIVAWKQYVKTND